MIIHHMSGAGNDFAVLDARGLCLDFSELAKTLCARLRADGLLAVEDSETADFRLHFYNADGSRGEMCGNGARCVCKFAYDMGIAGEAMTVETDAGLVFGWRLDADTYRVKLNDLGVLDLTRLEDTAYVELGSPGVPHSVTELKKFTFEDKEALLPRFLELRHNPVFPKGVNVNFFTRTGENAVRILTYERGVEDFTLACGTGSASVAVVLHQKGQLPGGVLQVENQGGILTVTVSQDGLFLEGSAKTIKVLDM